MRTVDQIVDGLGGTSVVASGLGLTPSTVSSWRSANFIPEWRQDAVLAFARRTEKPLDAGDFPKKAARTAKASATAAVDRPVVCTLCEKPSVDATTISCSEIDCPCRAREAA